MRFILLTVCNNFGMYWFPRVAGGEVGVDIEDEWVVKVTCVMRDL